MADTAASKPEAPKAQAAPADPIESEIYVSTPAFATSSLDDEDARGVFIDNHKGKINVDSVKLVSKTHDIGTGVTYVFRADPK